MSAPHEPQDPDGEPQTPDNEPQNPAIVDALPEYYGLGPDRESAALRRAVIAAVVFHAVLLLTQWPTFEKPQKIREAKPSKVFVVQQLRYQPPAPQRREQIPKRKARKIPIPDPTPNDPEPLFLEELDVPEIEMSVDTNLVFGIPDAPPGPSVAAPNLDGVMRMGSGITPPVKLHAPRPLYTEEARKARTQGVVLFEAVVDEEGNVIHVEVLQGLPFGLTDTATKAVKTWKYKPATKDGKPVSVYINLVVRFWLH